MGISETEISHETHHLLLVFSRVIFRQYFCSLFIPIKLLQDTDSAALNIYIYIITVIVIHKNQQLLDHTFAVY